jgi:hypothetical protein
MTDPELEIGRGRRRIIVGDLNHQSKKVWVELSGEGKKMVKNIYLRKISKTANIKLA